MRAAYTEVDFTLQEFSHIFPTAEVCQCAFPEEKGWSTSVLHLRLVNVSAPFKRPRAFSWTTGRRVELVAPCTSKFFSCLCSGKVETTGHDFFCVPQEVVKQQLLRRAAQRNVMAQEPFSDGFESCLPELVFRFT